MSTNKRIPDFFIVGAQRSGTTSLYEYLRQHPALYLSPRKETHYFAHDRVQVDADQVVRSEAEYLKLFDDAGQGTLLGEASPSYLWHPEAAQRIMACQPHAKIIASLRDPIARAFSQYRMDLADGLAPISFHDLIERDYYQGEKMYGTGRLYIELGKYAEQIKRYLDLFGAARVLVIRFDDLTAEPQTVLAKIASFLGIDPAPFAQVDTNIAHNRNAIPQNTLALRFLPHRSLRRFYRTLMPAGIRRNLRERVFDSTVTQELDADSKTFLRQLYAPQMSELESLCRISFPEFEN